MTWKDDRNLGPWAFTKQSNKLSYNEGDHIAPYNNPVWSMAEGSNIPITPTHTPCGYWPIPPTVPPIPTALDFSPFDICSDGTYLYICGDRYDAVTLNYICKIIKVRISDFVTIDSVEFPDAVSAVPEYYAGIRYSNGYIYIAGYGINGLFNRAILHCRPVSNLATLTWSYNYSVAGMNCWFHDLEVDDDYVYAIGNRGSTLGIKVKVNKVTGAQIWEFHNTIASPVGINQYGDYLYIYGHGGGLNAIEKVLKSDGSSTTYNTYMYDPTIYIGNLYRGCLDGSNIFVCGMSPHTVNLKALTMKVKMSDMSWVWSYRTDRKTGGIWESTDKCVQDGLNIYTLGKVNSGGVPYAWDAILEKLDMDGNLVLSKTIMGYSNYAILQSGDYLYLAIYDYSTNPGFQLVERRLKSTLEIG